MAIQIVTGADALAIRKKLRLNQSDFWSPLSVTQSGGSRYESGRDIPGPVQLLLCVKYGNASLRKKAGKVLAMDL